MKKFMTLFFALCLILCNIVSAEKYQIVNEIYFINGITGEQHLQKKVKIDHKRIFNTKEIFIRCTKALYTMCKVIWSSCILDDCIYCNYRKTWITFDDTFWVFCTHLPNRTWRRKQVHRWSLVPAIPVCCILICSRYMENIPWWL